MSARRFDEFKDPNMDGSSGGWNAEEGHLLEFFFSPTEIDSEGGLKQESSMEPPSTPAIQYYASSRSNNKNPPSNNGIPFMLHAPPMSNRLRPLHTPSINPRPLHTPSINPPLASRKQQSVASHVSSTSLSSHQSEHSLNQISPAAMVSGGVGQETLLLPPEPIDRKPASKTITQQQQQPEPRGPPNNNTSWFHYVNTLAQNAASAFNQLGPQPPPNTGSTNLVHPPNAGYVMPTSNGAPSTSQPQPPQFPTHIPITYQVASPQAPGVVMVPQQPPRTLAVNYPVTNHIISQLPQTTTTATTPQHHQQQVSPPPDVAESAEKKARRLARNRESARKSRRRKKETLTQLQDQVNKLYTELETERREVLNEFIPSLEQFRSSVLAELVQAEESDAYQQVRTNNYEERLRHLYKTSMVDGPFGRAAIRHQYSHLRQLILPKYHSFLLWLLQQPRPFLTNAKEERLRSSKGLTRITSKQIGEDLVQKAKSTQAEQDSGVPIEIEPDRMWPYFCYDMSLSADQEEQFLQAHQSFSKSSPSQHRAKMASLIKLTDTMEKTVAYQSRVTALQQQKVQSVLTPSQNIKLMQWFAQHKEKNPTVASATNESLTELSRRLEESLKIRPQQSKHYKE